MFEYQRTGRYFAQIGRSLEALGQAELLELGAREVKPTGGGLYFEASAEVLYRVNCGTRLISRVLAPLLSFPCPTEKELYQAARQLEWESIFSQRHTFAVFAHVSASGISHSHFAALRLKDAVADRFRERSGQRPDVDTERPDVWLNLNIHRDQAVISLDTSGGSLHRRGYRVQSVEAPMQETLAAAVIRLSGWQGDRPLVDPMCGSGTLLAEAFMHYCRIPASFRREKFGFEFLPDFDLRTWHRVREAASAGIRPLPEHLISGSDIDRQAVSAARRNLREIPGSRGVQVEKRDFRDLPKINDSTIVCNPPYSHRVGELEAVRRLYGELGDFLKQRCTGSTAYILCGNLDLVKAIGLNPSRRFVLYNGPIECRLVKIDVY